MTEPWRIVFMGTPEFAVPSLAALLAASDPVVGVFTQPDKPSGRGMKLLPPPVKALALERNIPVFQPARLRLPEAVAQLRALEPDLVVVAAYGQILSREVLDIPRHGCINVHASLLPRWRGAAPIHRALLEGDGVTGVTIMVMEEGLDTGPMLATRERVIEPEMTGGQLHDCLSRLGAGLLRETVVRLKAGEVIPVPQPGEGATYARKLTEEDRRLDWRLDGEVVLRTIRAMHPYPAAAAVLEGELIKILAAHGGCGCKPAVPGTVVALHAEGPEVACGTGSVTLTQVQPPGKRAMAAADWLRGRKVGVGQLFQ